MKQRKRTMTHRPAHVASAPRADEAAERSPRLSRTEAAIDVPREDDPATTTSTHTPASERRNEEPADGPVAVVLEDST